MPFIITYLNITFIVNFDKSYNYIFNLVYIDQSGTLKLRFSFYFATLLMLLLLRKFFYFGSEAADILEFMLDDFYMDKRSATVELYIFYNCYIAIVNTE